MRIIALYDIFLVELEGEMKMSPSERDCYGRKEDLCGYLDVSIWCHDRRASWFEEE